MQRATDGGRQGDLDPERFEHVSRAGTRGRRPPTVLADRHPGAGHDEGGDGRDVDGAGPVAAGAAGVDQPAGRSSGTGTVSATSSMAPNMPVSSSDVSPLHRSPKMNAAICDGLAAPSRISRSAAADSAELRSWRAAKRPSTAGQPPMSASDPPPGWAGGGWDRARRRGIVGVYSIGHPHNGTKP